MGSVTRTKLMSVGAMRDDRPPPHAHLGCDPLLLPAMVAPSRLPTLKGWWGNKGEKNRMFITKPKVLSQGPPAPKTTDGSEGLSAIQF